MAAYTRYVDLTDGLDTNDGLALVSAYLTLLKATKTNGLTLSSADTLTIIVKPKAAAARTDGGGYYRLDLDTNLNGATIIVKPSGTDKIKLGDDQVAYVRAGFVSGNVTVQNVDWQGTGRAIYQVSAAHAESYTLEDCTLDTTQTTMPVFESASQSTGTHTLRRCACTRFQGIAVFAGAAGPVVVENTTFAVARAQTMFTFGAEMGDVTLDHSSLTWAAWGSNNKFLSTLTPLVNTTNKTITLNGNKIYKTGGNSSPGWITISDVDPASTALLNIDMSDNTVYDNADGCPLSLGTWDGILTRQAQNSAASGKFGDITIDGNVIINAGGADYSGGSVSLKCYRHSAATETTVTNNYLSGGSASHSCYLGSNDIVFTGNVSIGRYPLLAYGDRLDIEQNTFIGTGNYTPGLTGRTGSATAADWEVSLGHTIKRNLFYTLGTQPAYRTYGESLEGMSYTKGGYSDDPWRIDHDIDENCYYSPASVAVSHGTMKLSNPALICDTIAQIRSVWRTNTLDGSGTSPYCPNHPENDSFSVVADPIFATSVGTGPQQYVPTNLSLILSDGGYIGAIRPAVSQGTWTVG